MKPAINCKVLPLCLTGNRRVEFRVPRCYSDSGYVPSLLYDLLAPLASLEPEIVLDHHFDGRPKAFISALMREYARDQPLLIFFFFYQQTPLYWITDWALQLIRLI